MPARTSPRCLSAICIACLGLSMPVAGGQQHTRKAGAGPIITDHLKVRIVPDEVTVTPGGRVALGVEIEPRPRMHVYAPGAENYQIISLTIGGPFVRALPVDYPPSEIYFFEPFKERIPVYQKPFKLIQEIIFENKPGAETAFREKRKLTLKGTLDYQACDDKVCFMPVSVPLSWTVQLRRK